MRSELYPLWVCVNGFNPWFQTVLNNRHPPWQCAYMDSGEGNKKIVKIPKAATIPDPCSPNKFLKKGDSIRCSDTTTTGEEV